ncbi:oleate hydratase [Clostridium algidicarnis]|uniref:Oleate hydratase n=2 Tax=Clostridium algidicarnis TaxID=37659 RepID=A0A2S6FUF8_9CLOT|nr:oleate hydratase [Clostridium algidicarnis]MBU3220942.1 oleate hydratase [Clostridium algidicarnis]PPK44141.1 oleate hydratase [Clostridium algidicarnis DSM 15099]
MYYTNGNYSAFCKPLKPEGIEKKSAYLIGGGLASLSAAAFLIRDGQMDGKKIYILEELSLPGGGCDGIKDDNRGYLVRGGREMEDHFECLWDLFRSIPSIETENASVLDEFYWLNQEDPSSSPLRVTENMGQDAHTLHNFNLSDKAVLEIAELVMTPERDLDDKRITDVFGDEFLKSNFWIFWRSMFAFEEWHSAIEMRRYLTRFIHHVKGVSDLSCLKFSKYNTYDSLILPLVSYLESKNVNFLYDTEVSNVEFDIKSDKKVAKRIVCTTSGKDSSITVSENDLVFVTLGCNTEQSGLGDDDHPAVVPEGLGASWELWKNIASQDKSFGNPEKFCGDVPSSNWESATITCFDDKIPSYIEKLTGRDPSNGKIVTGGPITAKDSSWLMSWTVSRQPHFRVQQPGELVLWVYGLFSDVPGDYIKKAMKDCTGTEITEEWLYHIGVPTSDIPELAKHSHCIPCMMPYVTSYFMVRSAGDRPFIVPEKANNFAFIGEHVETPGDTVFTTEYAVRTGMEAVYTLLDIKRGVPEVFASAFDARYLLQAAASLLDGRKLTDVHIPLQKRMAENKLLKEISGTVAEDLLKECNLI